MKMKKNFDIEYDVTLTQGEIFALSTFCDNRRERIKEVYPHLKKKQH